MSRTLSAALASHLATDAHTRCNMLRLDLTDGSTLAITDHDRDLAFDLGDGAVSYSVGTGILPSDLALSTGFNADDIEVEGPIGDVVTRVAVIGGRYDDAVARLFQVNWSDLTDGPARLLKGRVVLAEVLGGRFKFTIQSEVSKFSQQIGDITSLLCRYSYGIAPCPAAPVEVVGTVTAVTDERAFTVSFAGAYANDFFNRGTVQFLSGELAGTRKVEIFDWTSGGGVVLWTGLAAVPEIGDTLTIRQGCYDVASNQSKTRAACVALLGDAVDFGGEPDLPGQDKMLTYPNPGGG